MKTRKDVDPALATYLDNLLIQLRLLEVSGDRIGQILAEVETHVADTGLGAVESFGEPGEYAATYAAAAGPAPAPGLRGRLRTLGVAAVGAFAGVAVGFGAMDLAGSVEITLRLLGMCLATLAVALLVMGVLWPQLKRDTARSFTPRRFTSRFMLLGGLTWLAGVVALVPIGLLPAGPTLVSVPGWGALPRRGVGIRRPRAQPGRRHRGRPAPMSSTRTLCSVQTAPSGPLSPENRP